MKPRIDHAERMRRMRYGDICTLLADRWGGMVENDDAGRDDLFWLLLYVSTGPDAYFKMAHTTQQWAPWMPPDERIELIDRVNAVPHLPSPNKLSAALGVTNAIRERLRIWRIPACDMTPAQRRKWRRQKDLERKRLARELRGAKLQAKSVSKAKPWEQEGIKRRAWYYRQTKARANGNGADHHHRQAPINETDTPLSKTDEVVHAPFRPR